MSGEPLAHLAAASGPVRSFEREWCGKLGFSLEHTTSLLDLADGENRTCRQISAVAESRLEDVRAKTANLRRMEAVLENYVKACPNDASTDCPIVTALSHVDEV